MAIIIKASCVTFFLALSLYSKMHLYNYNFVLTENNNLSEDNAWYFFSSRTKKYSQGARPDRAAGAGFWKATGRRIEILDNNGIVGWKTSLAYYTKPPSGSDHMKTNWLMAEYQIQQNCPPPSTNKEMLLDKWVLCKIYQGKRSLTEKARKGMTQQVDNVIEVHNEQQVLAYADPPSSPPALVTQVNDNNPGNFYGDMTIDEMMQFYHGEVIPQSDPQPSLDGPVNTIVDFNDMTLNDGDFMPLTSTSDYDLGFFDPELDFFAAQLNSVTNPFGGSSRENEMVK